MITKICPQCNKEFIAVSHRSKFCSKLCSSKSMMKRHTFTCAYCGKQFEDNHFRHYCSKVCADKSRTGIRVKPVLIKNCPVCNQEFEADYKKQIFCSKKCAYIGRRKPNTHYVTEDYRKQLKDRAKKLWENPEFRTSVISRMKTDNPVYMPGVVDKVRRTRLQRGSYSNNFKYGNGKISAYEQKVYDRLISVGFYYNYAIPTKLAKDAFPDQKFPNSYKPDFVNLQEKLCIEIDGRGHSSSKDKLRDTKKEKCLQFLGFTTIRFTHAEIDNGVFDTWLNSYQDNI